MRRLFKQAARVFGVATVLMLCASAVMHAQPGVTSHAGTLADGAKFLIEVPANWNGTLFLYSHGYVTPGSPNPATDVGDPITRFFMLSSGYALAGSSYATTGWAIHEALPDQMAVLDQFDSLVGKPQQTIAWGHSLGGMITAGLIERFPNRFTAALPMCGVLSGGVATWNSGLDGTFAFKTLLAANTPLQVVNITINPLVNLGIAEQALAGAQATAQGRARIALVGAVSDLPGWFDPTAPEPAATDFAARETNQFLWQQQVDFPFGFAFRAELEARAQGNPSWNAGVDYRRLLQNSIDREEVRALYREAGISLDSDLDTLNEAARIKASGDSVAYLEKNIVFTGEIHIPVLTLHTKGDGLVIVQNESAYKDVVEDADRERLLQQRFVSRAGHCTFTPAETISAVRTLINRVDTGRWQRDTDADELNSAAASLGPSFNVLFTALGAIPTPAAFVDLTPTRYPRPFDAFDACELSFGRERECRSRFDFFEDR